MDPFTRRAVPGADTVTDPRTTASPDAALAGGGVRPIVERLGRGSALRAAVVVLVLSLAIALATWLVIHVVRPGTSGTAAAAVALLVLTGLAVALLALAQDVRLLGWRPPAAGSWRLLVPPLLLTLVPLAGGVRGLALGTFGFYVVAYALTGFTEEVIWRGAVLQTLLSTGRGAVWATVTSGLLFGAAHLSNVAFRGAPAIVVAQAVGATCFGIGYGALRLRTASLWPLIGLHLLTDLVPHVGGLPAIPVFVGQDVFLLGYGLYLLRSQRVRPT